MERPIRVLVADPVKLVREVLIEVFASQPDIEVVGEVSEESEVPARVLETRPDIVFIGVNDPDVRPELCDVVLRANPEVSIIAIAARSNRSVRYWASQDIHSSVMESSEEAILEAVRRKTAVRGEMTWNGKPN